jgi:uncharacterized membrane protein required for colicin V production
MMQPHKPDPSRAAGAAEPVRDYKNEHVFVSTTVRAIGGWDGMLPFIESETGAVVGLRECLESRRNGALTVWCETMLNTLDIVIISTFLAVIAVGFFNGVTKITAAILSNCFGSIVSAAFYRPVTDGARNYMGSMSERMGQLFFVILFFVFSAAFTFLISSWLGGLKLPRRVEIIDNVGGAALGVVVSGLAVTMAAMLLMILLQALNQTFGAGDSVMVGFMHHQISGSTLVPIFLKASPHFVRLISPWFPSGLPPILAGSMEA